MNRFRTSLLVLGVFFLFGFTAITFARSDEKKEKQRPKNAPVLDDSTGTLTEMMDGKENTRKLDLKHCLKVKGYFDTDGFNVEEVEDSGPATKLTSSAGDGTPMRLEKGDIITEIDGKQIRTSDDYVTAMNNASDPTKTKIKVKDINTNQERDFTVECAKR
jgi:S1-C subfamily serine protease